MPNLLFARSNGELLDLPGLKMAGRTGFSLVSPRPDELIPLPQGATLTALPGRLPLGIDRHTGKFLSLGFNPYRRNKERVWAVGALLPQGFTRTLVPAYAGAKGQKTLPLLGYTAVGLHRGKFVVAAVQTDEDFLWNPENYHTHDLPERVNRKKREFPQNRLVAQLATCSLEYGCFTAQNIFYGRWEGGIPVSPECNALCVGCISSQPSECCPAPQRRLNFVPTVQEIVELAVPHLHSGENAMISFGQGCEGEPSLQAGLIAESIKQVRKETAQGTININTNAGHTANIKKIVDAGIDAMRVSMISPTAQIYHAYHRPRNYGMGNVIDSLAYAARAGVFTSLNLLAFPGFTDDESEIKGLIDLIKRAEVKKVQLRNLNIDPAYFLTILPERKYKTRGIPGMISMLRQEVPDLEIGNYSRAVMRE
ncbi:radical SAM protein [Candidatus Formimonas warabiya]|uniref:radical SAM protein n=1 Tax=Formimonas warabiya TaxID=1761012 RepID=UPI001F42B1C8|nr:radical SAM protein [Candidatus Formimonas warabiya]